MHRSSRWCVGSSRIIQSSTTTSVTRRANQKRRGDPAILSRAPQRELSLHVEYTCTVFYWQYNGIWMDMIYVYHCNCSSDSLLWSNFVSNKETKRLISCFIFRLVCAHLHVCVCIAIVMLSDLYRHKFYYHVGTVIQTCYSFFYSIISFCSVSILEYTTDLKQTKLFSACSWWTGEWSECSRSCNGGLRTREVLCKRRISVTEEKVLDDSACSPPRPSLTEPCSNHSCPPEWLALDWSEVGRRQRSPIMHVFHMRS